MKKHIRLFGALVASCAFINVAALSPLSAMAESTIAYDTFVMEKGAAARVRSLVDENGQEIESNGLRFSAEISTAQYTALKEAGARFGVVIVAKDLLKGTEINETTVFGETPSFYFTNEGQAASSKIAMLHIANAACANIDEDNNIEICGSIVNIKTNNFTRNFVGRAYVAIPQQNAETGETEYTYHFAPYYEGNMDNNSRCIYYVSQRAQEKEDTNASFLQEKYITPFSTTSRFTDYTYRYFVEHCYVHHDENNEHEILHIEKQECYAELNSKVVAEPIIKPSNVPAIANINFVYDINASAATSTGLVYAGGMQTLRLYYETASTIAEDNKQHTLESLVADFLNVDNVNENFGLSVNGTNYMDVWEVYPIYEDPNAIPPVQKGIRFHVTTNANKNRELLLSKSFFDQLRAFGVESMIFRLDTSEGSNSMRFQAYQEESQSKIPIYDAETGKEVGKNASVEKAQIFLKNITPGGGVLIEIDQSSSSSTGNYEFGEISFTFPTTDQGKQGN